MRHLMTLVFVAVLFTACSKDESNGEKPTPAYVINTEEGSSFKVTGGGKAETITGAYVTLGSGQLMNQSFYRQYQISTSQGSFYVRFSFPSSMIGKAEENMFKEHTLYEYTLPLQESGTIKSVVAEAYFSSSSFFDDDNASGNVVLRNNYSVNGVNYSIFGEIDADIEGNDGIVYNVKGYFWKK